jgi:Glycosyl hydrolases family 16
MFVPGRRARGCHGVGRRALFVAAVAALGAALIPSAGYGATIHMRLRAVARGRVSVRLTGPVPRSRLEFVLDGHRARRTARHALTLNFPRSVRRHRRRVRWHRITVRLAGSRRSIAQRRFALATRTSRRAPTLLLLHAPPRRSHARSARLRFSVSNGQAICGLDGGPWRPCASPKTYRGLSPGAHRLTIRSRSQHGRASVTVKWTTVAKLPVVRRRPTPPPAAGRKLVFEDDFNGRAVNTARWRPYDAAGNAGNGLRRPSAVSLDGHGNLVITASMANGEIVSGGMSSKLNLTYGTFVFRVRTDPDPTGTMSGVVLTWPQSGRWPEDGEEDIYETGADINTRRPFSSFIHYGTSNEQYYFHHNADGAQWHTMAMDWSAHAIRIYRDGALVWTLKDPAAIPHVAHHLCIQLDARASRRLTRPVRMYVDYVRIYH